MGRDAFRRVALFLQQLAQQAFGRLCAPVTLNQKIQNLAFLIDRTPQPVFSTADSDHHFVEMPI